jgi:hypothetical protein
MLLTKRQRNRLEAALRQVQHSSITLVFYPGAEFACLGNEHFIDSKAGMMRVFHTALALLVVHRLAHITYIDEDKVVIEIVSDWSLAQEEELIRQEANTPASRSFQVRSA